MIEFKTNTKYIKLIDSRMYNTQAGFTARLEV